MRSPICSISSMRCVMKITPTPASREVADDREQAVAGGDVERRGRLVEDQDLRVAHERAHDAARLTVGERELLDGHVRGRRRGRAARRASACARAAFSRARDARAPRAVGAEPDVVEHRAGLGDEDLLEDRDDAAALRLARRPDRRDELAVELDLAGVRGVDAAEDLDQRRLAGAVLADERVDLAGAQLEGGVADRLGRAERLGDVGDAQERRRPAIARRPCGRPAAALLGARGVHRSAASGGRTRRLRAALHERSRALQLGFPLLSIVPPVLGMVVRPASSCYMKSYLAGKITYGCAPGSYATAGLPFRYV